MINTLRAASLLCLIWSLTSFGFAAGMLMTLLGQPSYISPGQLYAVTVVCSVSTFISLGLTILLALNLLRQKKILGRLYSKILIAIGISFCGFAAYAFLITATDQPTHFFMHFFEGARFEFLSIGVIGLVMGARWV